MFIEGCPTCGADEENIVELPYHDACLICGAIFNLPDTFYSTPDEEDDNTR